MSEFRRGLGPLVACVFGTSCGLLSITFYTQGIFVQPVTAEFGWDRGEFFLGYTLMMLTGLVTAPLVGSLIDRYGPKPIGIIGLTGHAIGYVLLALTPGSLIVWYATFVMLAVLSAGSLPMTWTTVVTGWFVKNRGLAIGFTMAGTGIAAFLAPPYAQFLIGNFGWRGGYLGLGLTALVVSLPLVMLLLRTHDADVGSRSEASGPVWGVTRAEAMSSYKFWALGGALTLISLSANGMTANFVPLLIDGGIDAVRAAGIASTMGLAVIAGRLSAGFLVDRFWAPGVAAVFFAAPITAVLLLAATDVTPQLALMTAALIGLALGAELDVMAYVTARYFGVVHYGAVFGMVYVFFTVASGLAPALWGRVQVTMGSYQPMLYFAAVALGLAVILLLSMGRYPREPTGG